MTKYEGKKIRMTTMIFLKDITQIQVEEIKIKGEKINQHQTR